MKPIKVISALLATAILCFSFVSCSDVPQQNPSFNFGHNPVVTNEQGEEITVQPTEESTTAHPTENNSINTNSTQESDTSSTATTKVTTTRKPYTFPTRPTTTAAPSTTRTTAPTTHPTTKPTTTAQPRTTVPVELPETKPTTQTTTQHISTDQIIENAAMTIFEYVNEERKKAGKNSLTYSDELADAAAIRSEELSENYSHIRPDGSAWHTVSSNAFGENIGCGYKNAVDAMNGWMSSAGHKSNILSDNYSSIGVGVFFDKESNTYFWVQLFGN